MEKLYKKDKNGSARVWFAEAVGSSLVVHHGLDGGAITTESTECKAKNVGRSNATTAEEQAVLERKALYEKKINRDLYRRSLDDELPFLPPMLALDASKVGHRIPKDKDLYFSRKLDGVRCTVEPQDDGTVKLISRKGTEYKMPHIQQALRGCKLRLDGELYKFGHSLNRIVAATKKFNELTPKLEFHVFDVIDDCHFSARHQKYLDEVRVLNHPKIIAVEQVVRRASEMKEIHDLYVRQGFEGLMVRVNEFPYEHCRSASLFKLKSFEEKEFEVIGVSIDKRGQGVLEFEGFNARMRGEDALRLHQAQHPEEYVGKQATVRYFSITEFGLPQFPVTVALRDYE